MLIQCDASQLEWRTILELAHDQTGINEILEGQDTHKLNQVMLALPPGDDGRLIAKIFLFRTIFKGSGFSFANDPQFMHVSTSPKFWDEMNEKFFAKYDRIAAVHNKWKDLVIAGKPIVSPLGRSWTIELKRDWKGELKIPWTTLTNYPVQGTGADVMMLVRIMAYKRIKKNEALAKVVVFVSTVHDSIVVDCPSWAVQQVVDIFHSCFDDLQQVIKQNFGYDWVCPMACECKYGPNMGDMKKIKKSS